MIFRKYVNSLRSRLQKVLCCNIPHRYWNSVYFPHPVGIVIGSETKIGRNVTIYQNVTIGRKSKSANKYPIIERDIIIYAGAVLFGDIVVGKNSVIGANALVSIDIPENSVVYGYNNVIPKPDQESNVE